MRRPRFTIGSLMLAVAVVAALLATERLVYGLVAGMPEGSSRVDKALMWYYLDLPILYIAGIPLAFRLGSMTRKCRLAESRPTADAAVGPGDGLS
jgi:lipopolysaccharide export LptBFGC system permease protein LptF